MSESSIGVEVECLWTITSIFTNYSCEFKMHLSLTPFLLMCSVEKGSSNECNELKWSSRNINAKY